MSESVLRFIGASIARMPGSVIEQLLAMRADIARFNQSRNLRTALLYTGGWFVQWHEGPADAVERTWAISRSHSGHSNPRVVHRSTGAGSLVEPVQIAALVGPDKATDVARRLFDIERAQANGFVEPLEVWRALSVPPSGRFASSAPLQCAIAVISEYAEAVEVVKALAERFHVPINYQRFAGADPRSGDAGAAYADLGGPGRTRVQALSRHALGYSLARLLFAHLDVAVLLAGKRPNAAAALSHGAAPYLATFANRPALHVAGLNGRSHLDAVLALVGSLGESR